MLRYLLATWLCLAMLGIPSLAQEGIKKSSSKPNASEAPVAESALDPQAVLSQSADAALKIQDAAVASVALAKVADVVWEFNRDQGIEWFERALQLASDEAEAQGVRGEAGRSSREKIIRLYAKRDVKRATKLVVSQAEATGAVDTPENARALAEALCELAVAAGSSDPASALELAKKSLETDVVSRSLIRLLGSYPPEDRRELLNLTLSTATRSSRVYPSDLLVLSSRLGFFRAGPPLALGDGTSPELARNWLASLAATLQRSQAELAASRAQGRSYFPGNPDLASIATSRDFILSAYEAFAPELFPQMRPLVLGLAAAAPPDATVGFSARTAFVQALQLGPAAMVDVADQTTDPDVADAIRRAAASTLAKDQTNSDRLAAARKIASTIRSDVVRQICGDEIVLQHIQQLAANGSWDDASKAIRDLSYNELRVQTYGALALEAARRKKSVAADLAASASRESANAERNVRVVQGLYSSALALSEAGDLAAAESFARAGAFVFDRLSVSKQSAPTAMKLIVDFGVDLGGVRVSPERMPDLESLGLDPLMRFMVTNDSVGANSMASGLQSPERRSAALLALAMAIQNAPQKEVKP